VSWKFFNERIHYEEYMLVRFYHDDYLDYAKKSYIGIPFIASELDVRDEDHDDGKQR
jgi:hypothetical protein